VNQEKLNHFGVCVYDNSSVVMAEFKLGKPIALVRIKPTDTGNGFGVLCYPNLFWPLSKLDYIGEHCYTSYFHLSLESSSLPHMYPIASQDIVNVCFADPRELLVEVNNTVVVSLAGNGKPTNGDVQKRIVWSIFESEWTELDGTCSLEGGPVFVHGYK